MRTAKINRTTSETTIKAAINLDGTGIAEINTGLGFLDHMITQIALHGLIDIKLYANGDLNIDPHHTLEDCALVLGLAIDQALADRKGIQRMGSAYVPMDEALCRVVIDLSGRPYTVFQAEWNMPYVGNIPTSLIQHFFESLASKALCNLHVEVLYGRDDHHQAEAIFKAFGRCLRQAVQLDSRCMDLVPSSKGVLK